MKRYFTGKKGFLILLIIISISIKLCFPYFRWIQEIEYSFFDRNQIEASISSSVENPIVIVGITEDDIKDLAIDTIEDLTLANLIRKIKQQQPISIGLDIIRDLPVGEGIEQLEKIYRNTDNLYGVGKFTGIPGDDYFQKIAPPPILFEKGKVGDVSVMVDDDGVIRRGNLYPTTGENGVPSLGLILAHDYLIEKGYEEKTAPSKDLQIGSVVFWIFNSNDGGYVNADDSGYQILMNWYHPPQSFTFYSVSDVLSGKIARDSFTNKIVLIGYYTVSVKRDLFYNPFSKQTTGQTPRKIFGVEVHANLISYLINIVTEQKPQLRAIPNLLESVILTIWVFLTGTIIWLIRKIKSPIALILISLSVAIILTIFCYYINYQIFLIGWWLPILPTIAIFITTILSLFYLFREKNLEYTENLELKIKERTLELEQRSCELNLALKNLKQQQDKLIAQEKVAFLGRLTAGFCHQFKNPLYVLKHSLELLLTLISEIDLTAESLPSDLDNIEQIIETLQEPVDKLELLFKLILISPNRKDVTWLNTEPNNFVCNIISSCLRFKFLNVPQRKEQIKIDYQLDDALKTQIAVPQQLEIPIFNIIDNAIDALVHRNDENNFQPQLKIQTIKNENAWTIIISDNGGGIDKSIRQSLFEPFVTNKPETHGIGLGLWISHEMLVKVIGGDIDVMTEDDRTQFTLTIPLRSIKNNLTFKKVYTY